MAIVSGNRTVASTLGVVIVAAGSGVRFGAQDKVFALLAGIPLLQHSLDVFAHHRDVGSLVVVLGEHTFARGAELIGRLGHERIAACRGGSTRAESVMAGIAMLPPEVTIVAVHDAARPCVTGALFERVLAAARATGAAIPVVQVADTIHEIDDERRVSRTPDRARLVAAQTPQIARRDWLEAAYGMAGPVTDEAGRLWAAGYPVQVVEGEPANMKVTLPSDLAIVEGLLAAGRGQSA